MIYNICIHGKKGITKRFTIVAKVILLSVKSFAILVLIVSIKYFTILVKPFAISDEFLKLNKRIKICNVKYTMINILALGTLLLLNK